VGLDDVLGVSVEVSVGVELSVGLLVGVFLALPLGGEMGFLFGLSVGEEGILSVGLSVGLIGELVDESVAAMQNEGSYSALDNESQSPSGKYPNNFHSGMMPKPCPSHTYDLIYIFSSGAGEKKYLFEPTYFKLPQVMANIGTIPVVGTVFPEHLVVPLSHEVDVPSLEEAVAAPKTELSSE